MPPKAWHVAPGIALRHVPQGPTGALALNALTHIGPHVPTRYHPVGADAHIGPRVPTMHHPVGADAHIGPHVPTRHRAVGDGFPVPPCVGRPDPGRRPTTHHPVGGGVLDAPPILTRSYSYLNYTGSSSRTTARLGTYTVKYHDSELLTGNRYEYDANGNITKIEEACGSGSAVAWRSLAEYTYDELNQLKTETRYTYAESAATPASTTVVTYTIDTAGNLSRVETTVDGVVTDTVEYTYGNAYWSDRLTAIKVNGTSKSIPYATYLNPSDWYNGTQFTGLTWTQGRRLSSITKGSDTYSYEYDMSGVRSVKIADGLKHEYVTQNGRIVRETVTNASTGAFRYALDFSYDEAGHPLTMRKYNNANMQNSYITMQYVCNAQGDVVKLIYNGTVYAEYTYDAWGRVLTATENGSYNYAALNPLRYRGYYYDSETGFYYLQSRYYDPAVKRFLNADSYGSTGQGFLGYNMFVYCNNNPVNANDPTGHFFAWIPIIIVPLLLFTGCSSDSNNDVEKSRKKLRKSMDLKDIPEGLYKDSMCNCYGYTIGKSTDATPSGYNLREGSVESAFECVQQDLGGNNCKRLSGIDAPVESGWYRAAMRCSSYDVHFLRQNENTWYSKSSTLLPAFAVTREEVLADSWYIIQSNSVNSWERYDKNIEYTGQIIFFAIREGWSE